VRILVAIPVFNEENKLPESIARLHGHVEGHAGHDYEIVIANNGSTDRTAEVAASLAERYSGVRVCHFAMKGRGSVLREVWGRSAADILTYMDVDLSTDLEAMPKLIESLACRDFDIVAGTRLHRDSLTKRSLRRELISRCYNYLVRISFSTRLSDLQCGFKGITKEAAMRLLPFVEDHGFFFDTEMLLIAEKCGYSILNLPVTWVENADSRVKILRTAWADIEGLLRLRRCFRANKYLGLTRQRPPAVADQ
jgi:glycosyltransferase involved in cell wall biosynthesis